MRADTNGPYALIHFDGALPRAQLYHRWEVVTNETETLARLASPEFNPAETVLVHEELAVPPAVTNGAGRGEAVIQPIVTSHRVDVRVQATGQSVLLLTDRFDPAWRVTVDGQLGPLIRCNYLMRGVSVPAGTHTVTFQYHPNTAGVWLMAACDAAGLGLLGFLWWKRRRA